MNIKSRGMILKLIYHNAHRIKYFFIFQNNKFSLYILNFYIIIEFLIIFIKLLIIISLSIFLLIIFIWLNFIWLILRIRLIFSIIMSRRCNRTVWIRSKWIYTLLSLINNFRNFHNFLICLIIIIKLQRIVQCLLQLFIYFISKYICTFIVSTLLFVAMKIKSRVY